MPVKTVPAQTDQAAQTSLSTRTGSQAPRQDPVPGPEAPVSSPAASGHPESAPERHGFFAARISFLGFVTAGGTLVTAATVIGFFGALNWAADLFSHFRVQYAVSLAAAAMILFFARRWRTAAFFGATAAVNVSIVAPMFVPNPGTDVPPGIEPVRAMLANVNAHFGAPEKALEVIRAVDPDILLLEEVSDRWVASLVPALSNYPHASIEPRNDNFGIALFSRLPFALCTVTNIGSAEVPTILAELHVADDTFALLGTHPLPPAGKTYSAFRNEQLDLLSEVVTGLHGPVIVMGDLNATPWSPHFRKLLRNSRLLDSGRGHGIQPTWPTHNFLLRLPLDHFLHNDGIVVTRREVGPDAGSDHYPLIVEFVVSSGVTGAGRERAKSRREHRPEAPRPRGMETATR